MAFKISADGQTVFFSKVFGDTHVVTTQAKSLVASGVKFALGLYDIRASYNGEESQVTLTYGTTALMKQQAIPSIYALNAKIIAEWIAKLETELAVIPVQPVFPPAKVVVKLTPNGNPNLIQLIKAIRTVTGLGLYEAKIAGEQVKAGETVPLSVVSMTAEGALKAFTGVSGVDCYVSVPADYVPAIVAPVAAKPVATVIKLKDALALGQQVHGTSTGSVYYCVALTDHVKVAARLFKSGSISIRAEWTDNPSNDLQKLEAAGLVLKPAQGYGSIHFDAGEVPMQRVVGAFLVGTGINWKSAVMNGAELVIGEQK